MKKIMMSAFLFMAVAGFANAQEVKTEKKQCTKTEKCCKDKKDSKKSCCKDKQADKKTKGCCKEEAKKK